MKLNIHRETTIGLSVLLVLLVILGVVAARRFLRPSTTPEPTVAALEAKLAEAPPANIPTPDVDSSSKPALLTPVATPNHDSLQPLDDPGNWNTAMKETRAKTSTSSTARTLAANRPGMASSNSTVIQVSGGEPADGAPQPLDRYAAVGSPAPLTRPVQPGPGTAPDAMGPAPAVAQPLPSPAGPVAGIPLAATASRSTYVAASPQGPPPSRYGYDPTSPAQGYAPPNYSNVQTGNAPSNDSATPGGYAPDNSPHAGGDVPGPMPAQYSPRGDGTYDVQPNDSYWTISERVYGSGAYFRALAEQNRGRAARPDRLAPGLVISTPPVAQLEKDYPDLCPRPNHRETVRNRAESSPARGYPARGYPAASMAGTAGGGRTYIVQEGDTLSSIARNELGKVSRWAEIHQLNREVLGRDYDYLTPGMRLVLPIRDASSGDRTARRSDDNAPLVH
jgi:nucleoid-associated protein YgaU